MGLRIPPYTQESTLSVTGSSDWEAHSSFLNGREEQEETGAGRQPRPDAGPWTVGRLGPLDHCDTRLKIMLCFKNTVLQTH